MSGTTRLSWLKKMSFKNAYSYPPKLDDNTEEGLVISHRGNIPLFNRKLDYDFRRIDNSARTLLELFPMAL